MVHIFVEDGMVKALEISGSIVDIGADSCEIVNLIYNTVRKNSEELGDFYKENMRKEIDGEELWDKYDIEKELGKQDDTDDGENSQTYNDAVNMLKDIIEEKTKKGDTNND